LDCTREIQPTSSDLKFYSHELRESVRFRLLGFKNGENPDGFWINAHPATLDDYNLPHRTDMNGIYHESINPIDFATDTRTGKIH